MSRNVQGSTFGSFLIGTLACAVLAGGALYFLSDTFRSRADSVYRQFSEWTPENIAADPIQYLEFAEGETTKVLEKLEASKIAIAQKRARLESLAAAAHDKIAAGEKALGELKSLYTAAEANGGWPAAWAGASRDRDWTRRQIVTLHRQIEGQTTLAERAAEGIQKLETQLAKVHEARAQCEDQMVRITTHREMLKVQEITDGLARQLYEMREVVATTTATSFATGDDGPFSLEDLVSQTASTVDEAEFQSILER